MSGIAEVDELQVLANLAAARLKLREEQRCKKWTNHTINYMAKTVDSTEENVVYPRGVWWVAVGDDPLRLKALIEGLQQLAGDACPKNLVHTTIQSHRGSVQVRDDAQCFEEMIGVMSAHEVYCRIWQQYIGMRAAVSVPPATKRREPNCREYVWLGGERLHGENASKLGGLAQERK